MATRRSHAGGTYGVSGSCKGIPLLEQLMGKEKSSVNVTLQAYVLQCFLPPPSIAWKILASRMFSE